MTKQKDNINNLIVQPLYSSKDKYRGWTAVLYPESMIPDWKDKIADITQFPFVYIVHDKDTDKKTGELLKEHVHDGIYFNGPTTYKRALKLFQELQPSCATCKPIKNSRYFFEYLIHNTETAKKEGKYPYDPAERITGNGYDIEEIAPMTPAEKKELSIQLTQLIKNNNITNFADFVEIAMATFGNDCYQVVKSDAYFFNCLIKGIYNRNLNNNMKRP